MREADIRNWERVEVERSSTEASRTDPAALVYTEDNLARYMNPPADTCYPLEYAYHLLGDVRGRRVLDFGCGSGENAVLLARRGAQVYGMDISHDLIKLAAQRLRLNNINSGVHLFVASAHDMALADESVDVIFGMNILHHLKLPLVAREVRRVLRRSGRLIFQEPVRNSKLFRLVRNLIPYRSPNVSPFERPLTDAELRDFASGYSQYSQRAFKLPYINLANILPVADRLRDPLFRLDGKLLRRFPSLGHFATTRVVAMVK